MLTRKQDTGRAGGGPECSSRAPPARPSPDLSSPARPPPPGHLRALLAPGHRAVVGLGSTGEGGDLALRLGLLPRGGVGAEEREG